VASSANVFGSGVWFEHLSIAVRVYLVGTALLEPLEGKVGRPRARPRQPQLSPVCMPSRRWSTTSDLDQWPMILKGRGRGAGVARSAPSRRHKAISLSGHVNRLAATRLPLGLTLRQFIYELGGGIRGERAEIRDPLVRVRRRLADQPSPNILMHCWPGTLRAVGTDSNLPTV